MKCFRGVLVFFSAVGIAQANVDSLAETDAGALIVNVWLNGVDRNIETVLLVTKDGEYIECKTLNELGVDLMWV